MVSGPHSLRVVALPLALAIWVMGCSTQMTSQKVHLKGQLVTARFEDRDRYFDVQYLRQGGPRIESGRVATTMPTDFLQFKCDGPVLAVGDAGNLQALSTANTIVGKEVAIRGRLLSLGFVSIVEREKDSSGRQRQDSILCKPVLWVQNLEVGSK